MAGWSMGCVFGKEAAAEKKASGREVSEATASARRHQVSAARRARWL